MTQNSLDYKGQSTIPLTNTNTVEGTNTSNAHGSNTVEQVTGDSKLGDQYGAFTGDTSVHDITLNVTPVISRGGKTYSGSITNARSGVIWVIMVAAVGIGAVYLMNRKGVIR